MKKETMPQTTKKKNTLTKPQRVYLNKNVNMEVTKTLNPYAKMGLLGIYTALLISFSFSYFHKKSETNIKREIASLKSTQQHFEKRLLERIENNSVQSSITNTAEIEQNIVRHINRKLQTSSQSSQAIIAKQNEQIEELKDKLHKALLLKDNNQLKNVLPETLTYSTENYDILYFKHRQVLKRLKEKQQSKEEAFLALYDISTPENQERWINFKDKQQLEYYKKEQELLSKRKSFRKRKYIKLSSNI